MQGVRKSELSLDGGIVMLRGMFFSEGISLFVRLAVIVNDSIHVSAILLCKHLLTNEPFLTIRWV